MVRPISRPMAAENTAWSYNAGGTRSQRDLVIWRSLRVRRGACPVMTRRDHRKPISMKKGRTHNSPDHALRPEERRSGGRLHLGTMDGLKSECLDGFRLDEVDGFVGILESRPEAAGGTVLRPRIESALSSDWSPRVSQHLTRPDQPIRTSSMKAVPKRRPTRARSVLWHIRDRVDYDRLDLIVQPPV